MLPPLQKATSCMARSFTLVPPSTGSSRRSTEVKNFPYIFRASSRKGNCRNCSVGVHIGPFESCPVWADQPWLAWLAWLAT